MKKWRIRFRNSKLAYPFTAEFERKFLCWKWWAVGDHFETIADAEFHIASFNQVLSEMNDSGRLERTQLANNLGWKG